jgi:hypothetical protein
MVRVKPLRIEKEVRMSNKYPFLQGDGVEPQKIDIRKLIFVP